MPGRRAKNCFAAASTSAGASVVTHSWSVGTVFMVLKSSGARAEA